MDHEQSTGLGRVAGLSLDRRVVDEDTVPVLIRRVAPVLIALVLVVLSAPASAHGTPPELVVEAYVIDVDEPLVVEYRIRTSFADGDRADAALTVEATSASGDVVDAPPQTAVGGEARFELVFTEVGRWTVRLDAEIDGLETVVEFAEEVPWPDLAGPGPVGRVAVDTLSPGREGQLLTPTATSSSTTAAASSPSTMAVDPAEDGSSAAESADEDAVAEEAAVEHGHGAESSSSTTVRRSLPASVIRDDVVLRWLHTLALVGWFGPVIAWMARGRTEPVHRVAVVGMVATILSGMALSAWSAPLASPGLFQPADLVDRPLGSFYLGSFVAKLGAVAVTVAATVTLIRHRRAPFGWVTLGGAGVALAFVTIMMQAHVFTHG